ncbi:hypothetical protein OIU34_19050 [Pararhizobium sp. BT-229]|uniref:hypothetical protein n=1 Tax=Pararhizobium sp. BT-229 TaxID=2986923 RepID=UPI0021F6AA41|nr:hypothetical protein [Pararhizobium sp. BT-229]MCV9963980.1 hypothetical protein [Pararhizobium sp. BT-229]
MEALIQEFTERYPHLVLEISGPWRDRDGALEEEPWIANFKNRTLTLRTVHPGSSGATMELALKAGIAYLEANPDSAPDCSPRPD